MIYLTIKQQPVYEQMSLEDFLFGDNPQVRCINPGLTNTRTYKLEHISDRVRNSTDVAKLVLILQLFNKRYEDLFEAERQSLYRTFYIPKKSGGYRRIDAPNDRLMTALRELKTIMTEQFGVLYHTAAYAYVEGRDTIGCMQVHQRNESKWFLKMDMKSFFNNTTEDFVMKQFSMIFPFCEVVKTEDGEKSLRKALNLAFLNGALPQGTPISPLITNVMMIPLDHKLAGILRDYKGQRFVYTRYADDIQISSKYSFDMKEIESLVKSVLVLFGTPFYVNEKKTRYGSSSGHNFNLGLMLNKDNALTVGHKKKRELRAGLDSYVRDKKNGIEWELGDIQVLNGTMNYCIHVEENAGSNAVKEMIDHLNKKHNVNVYKMIHDDLKR